MHLRCSTLLLLFAGVVLFKTAQSAPSNGWNDKINWKTLREAFESAKLSQKNVMLVVHSLDSIVCNDLRRAFACNKRIESLSAHFEMVNIDSDQVAVPEEEKYAPDGHYVPRIMFYGPQGFLKTQLRNPTAPAKRKYFYKDAANIQEVMRRALQKARRVDESKEDAGVEDDEDDDL